MYKYARIIRGACHLLPLKRHGQFHIIAKICSLEPLWTFSLWNVAKTCLAELNLWHLMQTYISITQVLKDERNEKES